MSALPSVYRAAPLDGLARSVTRLTWGIAVVFVLVGAWFAATQGSGVGWVLLVVGVLIAAMMWSFRRLQPLEYVVEDGGFAIRRRSAAPMRFAGVPVNVREGKLGLRVAGDGGAYGYLGRFRAEGRTVRSYVTDRSQVTLFEVGGTALAVSPGDRDTFLTEVRRGGA